VVGVRASGVGGPNMRIQPTPPSAARLMRLPLCRLIYLRKV